MTAEIDDKTPAGGWGDELGRCQSFGVGPRVDASTGFLHRVDLDEYVKIGRTVMWKGTPVPCLDRDNLIGMIGYLIRNAITPRD